MSCRRSIGMALALLVVSCGLLLAPANAGAAAQVGETPVPGGSTNCDDITYIQSNSPGGRYTVPASGVITSWSFRGGTPAPVMRFVVARPVSGNTFTIVGKSDPPEFPVTGINTFTSIRIAVQPGDVLGAAYLSSGPCIVFPAASGYVAHAILDDPAAGATIDFGSPQSGNRQLDVSATLEPDCDSDGFGDETQDSNIDDCIPDPDTTITKGPKDKTRKKTATFVFAASIAGSSFECSLDGESFRACSSPTTYKVKRGTHAFEVRATSNGQVDASAASDDWKVKKKPKKK